MCALVFDQRTSPRPSGQTTKYMSLRIPATLTFNFARTLSNRQTQEMREEHHVTQRSRERGPSGRGGTKTKTVALRRPGLIARESQRAVLLGWTLRPLFRWPLWPSWGRRHFADGAGGDLDARETHVALRFPISLQAGLALPMCASGVRSAILHSPIPLLERVFSARRSLVAGCFARCSRDARMATAFFH